jgi:hypothetical protein
VVWRRPWSCLRGLPVRSVADLAVGVVRCAFEGRLGRVVARSAPWAGLPAGAARQQMRCASVGWGFVRWCGVEPLAATRVGADCPVPVLRSRKAAAALAIGVGRPIASPFTGQRRARLYLGCRQRRVPTLPRSSSRRVSRCAREGRRRAIGARGGPLSDVRFARRRLAFGARALSARERSTRVWSAPAVMPPVECWTGAHFRLFSFGQGCGALFARGVGVVVNGASASPSWRWIRGLWARLRARQAARCRRR